MIKMEMFNLIDMVFNFSEYSLPRLEPGWKAAPEIDRVRQSLGVISRGVT